MEFVGKYLKKSRIDKKIDIRDCFKRFKYFYRFN